MVHLTEGRFAACALVATCILAATVARGGEADAPPPEAAPRVQTPAIERVEAEFRAFAKKHSVENAAIHYLQAMLRIAELRQEAGNQNLGRIVTFMERELQQAPPEILADYPEAVPVVRGLADPVVTSLHRGAQMKRCCFDLDWSKGPAILMPHLSKSRELARAAVAYGKLLEFEKRPAEAADVYLDIVRMGLHMGQDPLVISKLLGISLAWSGLQALELMLARGVDEKTAGLILDGLKAMPERPFDMSEAVECERVAIGGWAKTELLRAAAGGRADVISLLNEMMGRELKWHEQLLVPVDKAQLQALIEAGFSVYEEHMKAVVEAMKGPYKDAAPRVAKVTEAAEVIKLAQEKKAGLAGQLIATMLPTYGRIKRQEGRTEARMGAMRLLAAAAFQKAGTGNYPGKVEELAKHFPEGAPKDPFTGAAFDYKLDGNGLPVIQTPGDDPGAAPQVRERLYVFGFSAARGRANEVLDKWRERNKPAEQAPPPEEQEVF